MPDIRPFRAYRYSEKIEKDTSRGLSDLVSPPYDVISPEGFAKLKQKSPYNSIRLCLAEDASDPKRYLKMADLYREWKKQGILVQDPQPSIYILEEKYRVLGKEVTRTGFIALLKVSPFAEKMVLPHEHTLAGPKVDRLELLKAMGAELSQIFMCYRDESLMVEKRIEQLKRGRSNGDAFVFSDGGVDRRLWHISDSDFVERLQSLLHSQSTLIADGHHRYETAIHFAKEHPERGAYVQVYFTNLNAPNFTILPIHRLFSLPREMNSEVFLAELKKTFKVEELEEPLSDDMLGNLKQRSSDLQFAVRFRNNPKAYLVKKPPRSSDDAEIFLLQTEIFEKILKWDLSQVAKGVIRYEHELDDFEKTLSELENGVGIFLPATDLNLVMKMALRGERMPQKSTFFYPKIASGLVIFEYP